MERITFPEGREETQACSTKPWIQTAQVQPGKRHLALLSR